MYKYSTSQINIRYGFFFKFFDLRDSSLRAQCQFRLILSFLVEKTSKSVWYDEQFLFCLIYINGESSLTMALHVTDNQGKSVTRFGISHGICVLTTIRAVYGIKWGE